MFDQDRGLKSLKNMASIKARNALSNLCLLRLKALGGRATAREIAVDIGKAVEFVQPRFSDLLAAGLVRDTGLRVRAGRGRPQVVWATAESHPADDRLTFETDAEFEAAGGKLVKPVTVQADAPSWFSTYGQ